MSNSTAYLLNDLKIYSSYYNDVSLFKSRFNFTTMSNRILIGHVLTTCGFTLATEREFIMRNDGLDCWVAFALISFEDLTTIRNNAPFTINVLQLKCLVILKFWIEEKIRMYKPLVAS